MSTIGLIIRREYVERIKSRSFIIGTGLVVLGMFALSFSPLLGRVLGGTFTQKLIVVASSPAVGKAISAALTDAYDVTLSNERATGPALPADIERQVRSKKYDGALVAYRSAQGMAFAFYPRQANLLEKRASLRSRLVPVALNADLSGQASLAAKQALAFEFKTVALNERYKNEAEETLANALVYFLLIVLYIVTIIYGVQVAQGVIEEKSNRVMEVMIGAVRPAQLLAGKIFGIGSLALTQMLIFAIAAGASAVLLGVVIASTLSSADVAALARQAAAAQAVAGMPMPSSTATTAVEHAMSSAVPLSTLVFLVVFFLIGFFSYAALFAGVGALCSKAEDVQQFNAIMMIPIIGAYLVAIMALAGDPDKPFIVWASMVPLLSPMVMFTRVALSSVPAWQIALSIAVSLGAIWGFTLLAAKLYRIGVLMYGKPPTPREILRALRAPT